MGALAIFKNGGNGVPASRRGLIDLVDLIDRRSDDLVKLQAGRRRLQDELELVDGARNELESIVAQESHTLVDRIKSATDWALSACGGPRATRISESLAASRLQKTIGDRAAVELDAEISSLTVELETLHAQKPAAIHACMVESAQGYRADLASIADDLRQTLSILAALDAITSAPSGDWVPQRRVVVELPNVGGMAAQAVVAPHSAIERATAIWSGFALELDADPMATIASLEFPHVSGDEDDGKILYTEYTATERRRQDVLASHTHGVK
jgi:hypothetical protein